MNYSFLSYGIFLLNRKCDFCCLGNFVAWSQERRIIIQMNNFSLSDHVYHQLKNILQQLHVTWLLHLTVWTSERTVHGKPQVHYSWWGAYHGSQKGNVSSEPLHWLHWWLVLLLLWTIISNWNLVAFPNLVSWSHFFSESSTRSSCGFPHLS